jgi:hypothetical protein
VDVGISMDIDELRDLVRTYLEVSIANLGYPVGMGMAPNPETLNKMAADIAKIAVSRSKAA